MSYLVRSDVRYPGYLKCNTKWVCIESMAISVYYNIPERLGSEEMSLVALELRFLFFFTLPELLGENFFISCLLASGFAENSECFNFPY